MPPKVRILPNVSETVCFVSITVKLQPLCSPKNLLPPIMTHRALFIPCLRGEASEDLTTGEDFHASLCLRRHFGRFNSYAKEHEY